MHDQTRRLVDDDELRVFVDHLERHALRLRRRRARQRRRLDADALPARDVGSRFRPSLLVFDGDVAGFEPGLQPVPRVLRKQTRERLVEAQAAELVRDDGLHRRGERLLPVGRRRSAIIFPSRA